MTDITDAVSRWKLRDLNAALEENARLRGDAEVARLRIEAAQQEIERLRDGAAASRETVRLTDAEREAVAAADAYMSAAGCHNTNVQKTLRGLLERLR